MIPGGEPDENAIVVRWALRRLPVLVLPALPACLIGSLGLAAVVTGSPIGLLFLPFAVLGFRQLLLAWRERGRALAFDRSGVWRLSARGAELIPWDELDGVGVQRQTSPMGGWFRSPPGRWGKIVVLELRFRDGEAELIDIMLCRTPCERALWRYAPQHLLFGEETRA
ncbi:hypothetical protein [Streptomyces mangrovisoli]|uniref:Uncharacterized protein n=1 Tax=Streptomyces mangrovisoli TaxID=1428628 RepID=A0A1J4NQV6_9ACTN|nr:hypothetical protein [Streptomyces mangrovisoli]OIJ64707.1 hypothetical protein WN71_027265 [Streptomyces mangrovisoli]